MYLIKRFKKEHLNELNEHSFGLTVKGNISEKQMQRLEDMNHTYSIFKDRQILACVGVTEHWKGRGEGWALIDKNVGADLLQVTKITRKLMDDTKINRIECIVDSDFEDGLRWAYLLGFKKECDRMKAYGRDGKDCTLFVRFPGD